VIADVGYQGGDFSSEVQGVITKKFFSKYDSKPKPTVFFGKNETNWKWNY